jgi:dihydroflavonol-4-reductase
VTATWHRWVDWLRPHLVAIRDGDERALLGSLERTVASHRLLAPFAAALGGIAMLLAGLRLLIVNWRLTLVQIVPAMWIWVVMYDLRIHVIRDDSALEVSGWALLPIGLAIVAITAACFFLNAVFGFAVAQPGTPSVRPAVAEARRHLPAILAWGSAFGLALALCMTVLARSEDFWFALALGTVAGLTMVAYVAVPARLAGVRSGQSLRDRVSAGAVGAALGFLVSAPPYLLGRIGLLMLGSPILRIPGFIALAVAVVLQAGATGAVRAVKMGARLRSVDSPYGPQGRTVSATLVTGATGTVGHAIAAQLAAGGAEVRALVRDVERARPLLPDGVAPIHGDVTDPASVAAALAGCERVFHAAGLPEQWRLDPGDFQRVNVEGTANVVEACLAHGVSRLVYTSTIDVFTWTPGKPFDESRIDPEPRDTVYERSKQEADRLVVAALERGLDAVFLHPSAVYGPAPVVTVAFNDLLIRLANRKIPMLLPGGMPVVHAEDVATGHLAAADQASSGDRFILSGEYLSLREIALAVREHVPSAKVPPVMPMAFARAIAGAGESLAKLTKRPPLIARGEQIFLASHPVPVADHARSALDWHSRPVSQGFAETLAAFRQRGLLGDS